MEGLVMLESDRGGATRRDVLRGGARVALAIPLVGLASGVLLAGCGSGDERASRPPDAAPQPKPDPAPTPVEAPPRSVPEPGPEPAPAANGGGAGAGELITDLPESAAMVAALQYTNTSEIPDQTCASCQLFTPTGDGLGKCQLFAQGSVKERGWCASWAAKVS
jgi:hypothetical protein